MVVVSQGGREAFVGQTEQGRRYPVTREPFMQAVRDAAGEYPARVYPLANPPDEADFLITRKLYAREHRIPLERAVLVPGVPHQ